MSNVQQSSLIKYLLLFYIGGVIGVCAGGVHSFITESASPEATLWGSLFAWALLTTIHVIALTFILKDHKRD